VRPVDHERAIAVPSAHQNMPGVRENERLERAFDWCRGVVRTRARNFYYGLRISPEPERSAVFALYAWMREADDLTDSDGPVERRRSAVEAFWERTQLALRSPSADDSELWIAFAHVANRYRLSESVLHDVVLGMLADLDAEAARSANGGEAIEICGTRDELLGYCDRVASTVGLCCVRIWGLRENTDERVAAQLATARGRAFQLTNILRDFAEDFDAGRVYLPREDFAKHGLTPAALRAWSDDQACRRFLGEMVGWAEGFYEESKALSGMIREDHVPTLNAMSGIYRGLLTKIAKDPAAIVSGKRVKLSKVAKVAIALKSVRAAKRAYDR